MHLQLKDTVSKTTWVYDKKTRNPEMRTIVESHSGISPYFFHVIATSFVYKLQLGVDFFNCLFTRNVTKYRSWWRKTTIPIKANSHLTKQKAT